jgi:polyhydroxyalkanoate synthesis regulator phasin
MSKLDDIYRAGLGALKKAREEGSALFDELVDEGKNLEREGKKRVKGLIEDFTENVKETTESLSKSSKKELKSLSKRLEELTKKVEKLAKKKGATQKPAKKAPKAPKDKKVEKKPAKKTTKKATKPVDNV